MEGDGRLGFGREDFSPRRKARKALVLYPVKGAVLAILAALRERSPQKAQKTHKRFVVYVPFVANALWVVVVGRCSPGTGLRTLFRRQKLL